MTYRHFMEGKELLDEFASQFYSELTTNPTKEDIRYFQRVLVPTQRR